MLDKNISDFDKRSNVVMCDDNFVIFKGNKISHKQTEL
jgi:hypothetical protein